jgi:hypothetical protein
MLYMFQTVPPPIIRSSKIIHTASGTCYAVTANFRCRGGVVTGLRMLFEHTATGIGQTGTAACLLASRQQYLLLYVRTAHSNQFQLLHDSER